MGRGQALPATELKDQGGYTKDNQPGEDGVRNIVGGGLEDNIQDTDTTFGEAMGEKSQKTMGVEEILQDDGKEMEKEEEKEVSRRQPSTRVKEKKVDRDDDPWKQARGGPSEEWQPAAWEGNLAPRRR